MRTFVILVSLLLTCLLLQAQDEAVFGKWKTIDDETGEAKAVVEIYKKDGEVYGKIEDILNPIDRDKTCIHCEGEEYNVPLIGLDIIKGLVRDDDEYEGGTIFDPERGREYRAKIWVDEDDRDQLHVRGYIMFLFRTQHWERAK